MRLAQFHQALAQQLAEVPVVAAPSSRALRASSARSLAQALQALVGALGELFQARAEAPDALVLLRGELHGLLLHTGTQLLHRGGQLAQRGALFLAQFGAAAAVGVAPVAFTRSLAGAGASSAGSSVAAASAGARRSSSTCSTSTSSRAGKEGKRQQFGQGHGGIAQGGASLATAVSGRAPRCPSVICCATLRLDRPQAFLRFHGSAPQTSASLRYRFDDVVIEPHGRVFVAARERRRRGAPSTCCRSCASSPVVC